jgi:hypothetical protein
VRWRAALLAAALGSIASGCGKPVSAPSQVTNASAAYVPTAEDRDHERNLSCPHGRGTAPADLRVWIDKHIRAALTDARERDQIRYSLAMADLDADGTQEAILHLFGTMAVCGSGGCGLEVLVRDGEGWLVAHDTSIGHPPIRMLQSASHGWRDLSIAFNDGGRARQMRLRFDGRCYPWNPSGPPSEPVSSDAPGRMLITGDELGAPLFPAEK